jgi:NAD(P)H-hydrate epimerase
LLFADPRELSADAAVQWNILHRLCLEPEVREDEFRLAGLFKTSEWIVDAMFGTGLQGPMRPPFDRVAELINASGKRVLAVDIPSGLDADTGEPMGTTVRAEHTITFVAPKAGFQNPAAATWLGQLHVADIGVEYYLARQAGV